MEIIDDTIVFHGTSLINAINILKTNKMECRTHVTLRSDVTAPQNERQYNRLIDELEDLGIPYDV